MPKTLLIIGVHLEELAFGKRVAEEAAELGIDVLSIEHGLHSDRRLYENFFYYTTFLQELYLQIHRQIQRKYGLVIDLHTGISETGRLADILCKETGVLDCLHAVLKSRFQDGRWSPETIRLLKIVKDTAIRPGVFDISYSVCRTFIPETVWGGRHYRYVGLEIYLTGPGEGSQEDWLFARQMVKCIHDCGKNYTESRG